VIEADRLAQQAGAELSLLIHELRPLALDERGLAGVLGDYLADWSRQSGIAGRLCAEGAERLPPAVEHTLLRVAQEALANVARHSRARTATVTLAARREAVTPTVADDGEGFAAGEARPGVGLSSMRERMAALGGRLELVSEAGAGTTVTAAWESDDG
jgi:signal transduction histidine kinase